MAASQEFRSYGISLRSQNNVRIQVMTVSYCWWQKSGGQNVMFLLHRNYWDSVRCLELMQKCLLYAGYCWQQKCSRKTLFTWILYGFVPCGEWTVPVRKIFASRSLPSPPYIFLYTFVTLLSKFCNISLFNLNIGISLCVHSLWNTTLLSLLCLSFLSCNSLL